MPERLDTYEQLPNLLRTQCGCTALTAVTLDPRLETRLFDEADPHDWTATLLPATETWRNRTGDPRRFYWYFALARQVTNDRADVALIRVGVSTYRADVGYAELVD